MFFIANAGRLFVLATITEPGILPRVISPEIDYSKSYNVEYLDPDAVSKFAKENNLSIGQTFFSLRKFKIILDT